MSKLTIRLPDDTHTRMKSLARHRAMSVNKLIEELCTTPSPSTTPRRDSVPSPRAAPWTKGCVSSTGLDAALAADE